MVLDSLNDSKDVLNAFKAFPELEEEGVLKAKRHLWLFDQVFPHIVTMLEKREVLACRQVCVQWSHAVDNFLENHPDNRANDRESEITGQHWIPEGSQAYYNLPYRFRHLNQFRFVEDCDTFANHMGRHPPSRNPFVGRSIQIAPLGTGTEFWERILTLLEKFGEHVWFLSIRCITRLEKDFVRIGKLLLECLGRVPNLKSLDIGQTTDLEMGVGVIQACMPYFPPLAQLETLRFGTISKSLMDYFIGGYSSQIKRLHMDESDWRMEYSSCFPNLTEIHLYLEGPATSLRALLSLIIAPNLSKLKISTDRLLCLTVEEASQCLSDVIPNLFRFPQLDSLTLDLLIRKVWDREVALPSTPFLPVYSLKSLVMNLNRSNKFGWNEQFFKWFPSLEYVKLQTDAELGTVLKALPKAKEVTLVVAKGRGKKTWHWRSC